MKKLILLVLLLVLLAFTIPILFTIPFQGKAVAGEVEKSNSMELENQISEEAYAYSSYGEIKLYHAKTNTVETIPLDTYLYGVVSAEMPVDFEVEALKAQAIVARTYTIYTISNSAGKHEGGDICDDSTCCQAWISKEDRLAKWEEAKREENWKKIVGAVNATKGKVIVYEGKPINAFFHSNSGGTTEPPVNVWGGTGYPYLQAVQTAGEENYSQYASEVTLSKTELEEKIRQSHSNFTINWQEPECIKILEYTDGNRVKTVKIGNIEMSGVEARTLFGLRSANFTFLIQEDSVTFQVKGYGHGVGMSQTGADSLAKEGKSAEEIIHHFYQNVEIISW